LDAQDILKQKAEYMNQHPEISVIIEGHCDERGTNEYNIALGERRAVATKQFMIRLGISADSMVTVSYGEERPADPGHSESAWAKNRRVHFDILQ
jgi:peptidoglycan-associated lipoprotein